MRLLMRQAWAPFGGDLELLDLVQVTGQPAGLLPSTLAALPAMTAAVAVSTLAAAVLDRSRSPAAWAPVVVDVENVAVAAGSERYARTAAVEEVGLFAPLSRFFRTADGWIRLHANYPWHRKPALGVLGCVDRPEVVEQAVLAWPGEALEDALAAAGVLGYIVRDVEAWRAHPQGLAVSGLPLVQTRAGADAGRVVPSGRAASGMRVLDLTRVIAGPVATRTLAGWGAEVLRLDSPDLPEIPAQAVDTLPGKRSAELDLRQPDGRDRMEVLLGQADLLIQGYRPGALARYGLDAQELSARHPTSTSSACLRGGLPARGPAGEASTPSCSVRPVSPSPRATATADREPCPQKCSITRPATWPPLPACWPSPTYSRDGRPARCNCPLRRPPSGCCPRGRCRGSSSASPMSVRT